MLRSMLFSLLLVTASQAAIAQTACPAGVAPGSPQCGPDSGTSRAEPAPPRMTGEWIKTWGAFAGSDSTGEAGTSANKLSESEAKAAALRQCALSGAKDCKIDLVYRNQCAAIATTPNRSYFQSAPTEQEAVEMAMKSCVKGNSGECKVLYSECTKHYFRKY